MHIGGGIWYSWVPWAHLEGGLGLGDNDDTAHVHDGSSGGTCAEQPTSVVRAPEDPIGPIELQITITAINDVNPLYT